MASPKRHPNDPLLSDHDRAVLRRVAETADIAERRARWWTFFAEKLLEQQDDGMMIVRYEDVIAHPTESLAAILSGFAPGGLRKPIEPSVAGSRRHLLDARDVDVIPAICGDAARRLGVGGGL